MHIIDPTSAKVL